MVPAAIPYMPREIPPFGGTDDADIESVIGQAPTVWKLTEAFGSRYGDRGVSSTPEQLRHGRPGREKSVRYLLIQSLRR